MSKASRIQSHQFTKPFHLVYVTKAIHFQWHLPKPAGYHQMPMQCGARGMHVRAGGTEHFADSRHHLHHLMGIQLLVEPDVATPAARPWHPSGLERQNSRALLLWDRQRLEEPHRAFASGTRGTGQAAFSQWCLGGNADSQAKKIVLGCLMRFLERADQRCSSSPLPLSQRL